MMKEQSSSTDMLRAVLQSCITSLTPHIEDQKKKISDCDNNKLDSCIDVSLYSIHKQLLDALSTLNSSNQDGNTSIPPGQDPVLPSRPAPAFLQGIKKNQKNANPGDPEAEKSLLSQKKSQGHANLMAMLNNKQNLDKSKPLSSATPANPEGHSNLMALLQNRGEKISENHPQSVSVDSCLKKDPSSTRPVPLAENAHELREPIANVSSVKTKDNDPFFEYDLGPEPPEGLFPRPIQFNSIPPTKVDGSIWSELLSRDVKDRTPATEFFSRNNANNMTFNFKVVVDCSVLDQSFFESAEKKEAEKMAKQKLAEAAAEAARKKTASVLDPKRSQNLEIGLKGLNCLTESGAVKQAVRELTPYLKDYLDLNSNPVSVETVASPGRDLIANSNNNNRLKIHTADGLHQILQLLPTADEIVLLQSLKSETPERPMAPGDKFLFDIIEIPRFKERGSCILTLMSWDNEVKSIENRVSRLTKCIKDTLESIESGGLRVLLLLVLQICNYVNFKTKKKASIGFSVSTLDSLKGTKTVDQKSNFLRVVAHHISLQCPDKGSILWDSLLFLSDCSDILDLNPDDIEPKLKSLELKSRQIDQELSKQSDEIFQQTFLPFAKSAEMDCKELRAKLELAKFLLGSLSTRMAEKSKVAKERLQIIHCLSRFVFALKQAHNKNLEIEKAAITAKSETMKITSRRSVPASPPPSVRPLRTNTSDPHEDRDRDSPVAQLSMFSPRQLSAKRPATTSGSGVATAQSLDSINLSPTEICPGSPLRSFRPAVNSIGKPSQQLPPRRAPSDGTNLVFRERPKTTDSQPSSVPSIPPFTVLNSAISPSTSPKRPGTASKFNFPSSAEPEPQRPSTAASQQRKGGYDYLDSSDRFLVDGLKLGVKVVRPHGDHVPRTKTSGARLLQGSSPVQGSPSLRNADEPEMQMKRNRPRHSVDDLPLSSRILERSPINLQPNPSSRVKGCIHGI